VVTHDLLTEELLQVPLVRAAAAVPVGAAARCGIPSATLIHAVADARRASNVLEGTAVRRGVAFGAMGCSYCPACWCPA
jgi:hypothetical protein